MKCELKEFIELNLGVSLPLLSLSLSSSSRHCWPFRLSARIHFGEISLCSSGVKRERGTPSAGLRLKRAAADRIQMRWTTKTDFRFQSASVFSSSFSQDAFCRSLCVGSVLSSISGQRQWKQSRSRLSLSASSAAKAGSGISGS